MKTLTVEMLCRGVQKQRIVSDLLLQVPLNDYIVNIIKLIAGENIEPTNERHDRF